MWWYHGDWGWGAWLVMTVVMAAFGGLVVWAFVNLARASGGGAPVPERTAEEILAERLATGEIDEAEYRRRSDALHAVRPDRVGRS